MTYGSDFSAIDDLTSNLATVDGALTILQNAARRLSTSRGALWYDPNYGTNLDLLIADSTLSNDTISGIVRDEVMKDERVSDCRAETQFENGVYTIEVWIVGDSGGVFPLTLILSAEGIETIVNQGE